MMFDEVLSMIQAVEDVSSYVRNDKHGRLIVVEVQDFEGFDEDWREVFLDYDEETVNALYEALEQACEQHVGDYYEYFMFDGFDVQWGYASDNI